MDIDTRRNELKRLQNELITIIDDDDYVRAGLSVLIESRGHKAATFASAEDYLASGVRENTACLILDVHLLGMSGPDPLTSSNYGDKADPDYQLKVVEKISFPGLNLTALYASPN